MTNNNDSPPEPPGSGDGNAATNERKNGDAGLVQESGAVGQRHPLLTFLFWVVALGFSAAVVFSNHWLADMALALLPIGLIGIFIVVGIVMLLRKR